MMRSLLTGSLLAFALAAGVVFGQLTTPPTNVHVNAVRSSFTDSPTALWASASGGASTGSCPSGTPCTLARALSTVSAGGTVILNSGSYAGVTFSGANMVGTTITAPAAVKNALTETCNRAAWMTTIIIGNGGTSSGCGTLTGTDNRPLFTSQVNLSASVIFEWMRVRMSGSRSDSDSEAVAVHSENTTVRYTEIFNGGQGIFVWVKRNVSITHNYIHALGIKGTETDTHGVGICGSGTESINFATQIYIGYNTMQDEGGDGVQEQTNAYCSGTFSYLTVEANYMTDFDEQCGDMKGTRQLKWHWNDCSVAPLGGLNATNDPAVSNKTNWDIWDNYFHDIVYWAVGWSQSANCSSWRLWNNVIARTDTDPPFNAGTVNLCGDANSYFVFNTMVDNTNGNASPRTWGVYDFGSGNNERNNICYRTGTGTDDRRCFSNISGEDGGTPNTNYGRPTDSSIDLANGGLGKAGTNQISTLFAAGNGPGFTNIGSNDYSLQSGSPAVDVGLALSSHASLTASGNFTPNKDITGKTRSGTPDLGAFER